MRYGWCVAGGADDGHEAWHIKSSVQMLSGNKKDRIKSSLFKVVGVMRLELILPEETRF